MAIYSDLLFSVSGDPIDVRASIYKNIATNILKVILTKRNIFLSLIFPRKEKKFSDPFNSGFCLRKKIFHFCFLCKYLLTYFLIFILRI